MHDGSHFITSNIQVQDPLIWILIVIGIITIMLLSYLVVNVPSKSRKKDAIVKDLINRQKKFDNDLEDIKKFLSNPDYEIVDEYGETYTFEQFFNEEVGKSLYEGKNGLEEGLSSYFFISDGLRFSSYEDFS